MKKLLLLPFLLISLTSFAQTSVSNFHVENGFLIYRQVFEVETTENGLIRHLMTAPGVTDITKQDSFIVGKVENVKVDWKKFGGTWGTITTALAHPISGNLLAELKDGRYRITVSNIVLKPHSPTLYQNADSKLDDLSLNRKKEFRTGKNYLSTLFYIDKQFTDMFTMKEQTASQDW